MKVLFVHDGPLGKDNKTNRYYGDHYKDEIRKRYLYLGNYLTFLIRVKSISDDEIKRYSLISDENFTVVEAPNHKSLALYFKNRNKVRQLVKDQVKQSDIIIIRLPSALGNFAVHYARKYNKPYLAEVVACPWDALWNHSLMGKLLAPFKFFKMKENLKYAPYAMYVTTEFLQRRYPTNAYSIALSDVEVSGEYYDLNDRISKIRNKPDNEPLILSTVAALNVKYKGHAYVIKAIADLKKEGYDFEYHMVGGGDGKNLVELAKKYGIEDKVIVVGPVKHDEVFKWFEKIDLYIQPSNQEGLPRALVEAMSRACPAIGSTAGGIPELLDKEFVFPKRNINALKKILRSVNKKSMEEQAIKNYNKAKSFTKADLEERRKEFYDNFLSQIKKQTE